MIRAFRLSSMEQYIIQRGTVTLRELTEHFDISLNTVRRDLNSLEERGFVVKVYGGVSAKERDELLPNTVRIELNTDAKKRIGELAASLVENNTTVFIDSGSTTCKVIPFLSEHTGITLLSHSLPAIASAVDYVNLNLITFGGVYNHATSSFVGQSIFNVLDTMSIRTTFIAATGVSINHGLTNTTYFEAEIKRAVCSHSRNIVLMADHTKFDREALISYCPLRKLKYVITDCRPSDVYMRFFESHGIKVLY